MLSDVLTHVISSLYSCFSYLLRTSTKTTSISPA
jgi:heme-binding NEAT domain protein